MAKDKKKVIVYADWIENFEDLTDLELGQLMRHFFNYINDEETILEDRILKIAWKPIESTLKRDLKLWEKKAHNSRENGKLGGRPKLNPKEPKEPSGLINNLDKPKKPVSVSVSVSDSVNVSVSDILLEKETKDVFKNWLDYRKEIKKPIKSEKTIIALAQKIKEEGLEKSKLVIETSIQNGWQGLFWDKIKSEKEKKVAPKKESFTEKWNFNELVSNNQKQIG